MFTVGEFSRLAQVSKRLLRYYDEIGLLKPVHTDKFSGYRFYSAEQLPALNRILALKDLGLSLEQIQRITHENISTDEIQGILLLKKAEIEQQLQGEMMRIRNIESRLESIRYAETGQTLDVVIKHIPAQPVLSVRTVVDSFETALYLFAQVMAVLPEKPTYGLFFGIWHSDGIDESSLDVEIGRILTVLAHAPVPVSVGLQLNVRELPEVKTMATFVGRGPAEHMHIGYSAIGTWAEVNGYRFAGAPREIALKLPQNPDRSDALTEIQFPVEPVRPA